MKKLYIILGVISALTKWSMCTGDYGFDEEMANGSVDFCASLNPQNQLDISKIEGIWYGSEVIQHKEFYESEKVIDSCVLIHIKETTQEQFTTRTPVHDFQHQYYNAESVRPRPHHYNYVTLIWEERGELLEYSLRYNTTRRGFWISSPPVPLDAERNTPYTHFTGTIQVMKAVGNHLVLTFCQSASSGQLFSIILTRRRNVLTHEDIQSVRNLLNRRGLRTTSIRGVCFNGSERAATFSSILLLALAFLFYY